MTMRIRSSRDHRTRPRFIDEAARIQYSQNAAQPTASASSTGLTPTERPGQLPDATQLLPKYPLILRGFQSTSSIGRRVSLSLRTARSADVGTPPLIAIRRWTSTRFAVTQRSLREPRYWGVTVCAREGRPVGLSATLRDDGRQVGRSILRLFFAAWK